MSARHTTRLATTRLTQLTSHFSRTMATSIPKTMKGVLVEKTGGVEVLEYKTDLPVPSPKEGEVLVKNDFIGINYIDTCVSLPPPSLSIRILQECLVLLVTLFAMSETLYSKQMLSSRQAAHSQANCDCVEQVFPVRTLP